MSTTIFTNEGRNAIAEALSTDKRLTITRVAFGDKGVTPNSIHTPNSQGLMNERFRMNVDNVYYPTVSEGNNAVVRVTATLTPEQASNMEPITVREFGLIDSTGNFIILGTTVTTLTKEGGNGNGISFDLNIALPSPDRIVNIVLNPNDGDFNEGYRLKLIGIEDNATKNKSDSFLTDRANHTGKQAISTIVNLEEELTSLNTLMNSKTSKFKGMFVNHNDFLTSLRVFEDGEETEAGNITNSKIEDNYFNNETKSVWYYKGENVWLDSNKHLVDGITNNTDTLTAFSEYLGVQAINSTPLGVFETIVDLPASPNFNAKTNSFNPANYNAFVKETKSTWWYVPVKDNGGAIIGGNWVESTGDLDNKLDKSGGATSGPIIGLKEKVVTMPNGIIDLDTGNIFIKNVTGNISFTVNNVSQESGVAQSFTLELINAGNYIITWWNNLTWDEGNPPTLPQNTTSIFGFYTTNNGNTWRGFVASEDMR